MGKSKDKSKTRDGKKDKKEKKGSLKRKREDVVADASDAGGVPLDNTEPVEIPNGTGTVAAAAPAAAEPDQKAKKRKKGKHEKDEKENVPLGDAGPVEMQNGTDVAAVPAAEPNQKVKKRKKSKHEKGEKEILPLDDAKPVETPNGTEAAAAASVVAPAAEPSQKGKKRKKSKHEKDQDQLDSVSNPRKDEARKGSKKSKTSKKYKAAMNGDEPSPEVTTEEGIPAVNGETSTDNGVPLPAAESDAGPNAPSATLAKPESEPSKKHRFIVFVGTTTPNSSSIFPSARQSDPNFSPSPFLISPPNKSRHLGNLPYNATTESIRAHFSSLEPSSIRHSTHKDDPSRSKGFVFLEFDGYARMETCLRKFHHSSFDDGSGGARKINVELTLVIPPLLPPSLNLIHSSPHLFSFLPLQS